MQNGPMGDKLFKLWLSFTRRSPFDYDIEVIREDRSSSRISRYKATSAQPNSATVYCRGKTKSKRDGGKYLVTTGSSGLLCITGCVVILETWLEMS